MALCTRVPHRLHLVRTFVDAKIKWVRDPDLDNAVEREKNLKQILSLKNQIVSSPSSSLPLSSLSPLKPHFNLPTSTSKVFQKYPAIFSQFQPSPSLPLHVKLTPQAMTLHKEELAIHKSPSHRNDAVKRLAKLLMLAKSGRLPLHIIDKFKFDLGLPSDYITFLLSDYPEYFQICESINTLDGKETLVLELISWRKELAVSEMEKRASFYNGREVKKGMPLWFSMKLPNGFDLEKKVMNWVDTWQDLPYISPYENAFHLGPNSDQAEKWTVAVLHELLWLLVSRKTERVNVFCLGDYLGFGNRFKKALVHFPGIFYVSNKIRTQTVVLREAYRKDFLVEKHPLMGMRFRYIHLMNKAEKFRNSGVVLRFRRRREVMPSADKGQVMKEDDKSTGENNNFNELSDSEFEDVSNDETSRTQIIDT
ncbi:Ubiquitin carboxyl-terminal hydrolase family protein [Theobroma cacao]|uniref:Ubiquitin carboxyl-terminal hydrolase family protein n=1 Tax=Theobroma cacao TaxID=3641 RepID=A0A061DXE3_THECC|nr:Ubiquitin carboxyl-terminal hydrolase family protein [Theobroma cacao]